MTPDPAAVRSRDRVRKGTLLLGIDVAVRAVAAVVVGSAVLRRLGPDAVGTLGVALAIVTIGRAACGLGFDAVMAQRVAVDPTPTAVAVLADTMARARVWTTLAALPFLAFAGVVLPRGGQRVATFALVSVGLIGGPLEIGWYYLLGSGRSGRAVPARLTVTALFALLRVGGLAADRGLLYFAALAGLELLVPEAVSLVVARREGLPISPLGTWRASADGTDERRARTRSLLRESWAFNLGGLCFLLIQRVDLVIVDRLRGTAEAGRYSAVERIAEAPMLLTTVLLSIAAPAIAAVHHRESEEHGRAYQRLMRHLFLVGILLAGVMNLAAGRVVDVLLGSAFAGIRGTVAIYAWSLVPVFVSAGRSRLAIDLGLHHRFLFNGIMAAVVNVALNFLLLPRLGIQGAAWATVIAYTASITVIPQLDPRQRTVQRHLWRAIGLRGTLRA